MTNITARTALLLSHGYAPALIAHTPVEHPDIVMMGTVVSNLAFYGVALDARATHHLLHASTEAIVSWWSVMEPALKEVTFADRNMDDFVVYKNFPSEVLNMDDAHYWLNQILMYVGFPNDLFAQPVQNRAPLNESCTFRVLGFETDTTLDGVAQKLLAKQADWTEQDLAHISILIDEKVISSVDFSSTQSRANAARLAAILMQSDIASRILVNAPTDVLRISAALSQGDAGLRTPSRVGKLPRPVRRALISMLNRFTTQDLLEDFGARPGAWKKLLHALHAGTTKGSLKKAADALRSGSYSTYNSLLEGALASRDEAALGMLTERPGVFMRRLHQALGVFGQKAAEAFVKDDVLSNLTIEQLLNIDSYVASANMRQSYLVTPRGKMSKAQVVENKKIDIDENMRNTLSHGISQAIQNRLNSLYPAGFDVSPCAYRVGLPRNGQESNTPRGTVFSIPENVSFLRSASFWEHKDHDRNTWFDNGWTFFDADWNQVGVVSWDSPSYGNNGIFSGDPTNSKDLKGRGCQMIDLHLDKLATSKAVYAVWSILAYSGIPFGDAPEVLATLQWGEDAQKGKLYEPSRSQIRLKLGGPDLAKAVAILDIAKREMVFLDANIPLCTQSAGRNGATFKKFMPPLMESIKAAPSMGTLFAHGAKGSIPVRYDDAQSPITGEAVVFSPNNIDSDIVQLPIEAILQQKGK